MAVQAVHHVNLRVRPGDIRRLRDFYCDILGLQEGRRPPFKSAGYWLYAGEVAIVHLVEMRPEEMATGDEYGKGAIDHVAFRCSDLDDVAARLRERGIQYAVSEVPEAGDIQFLFRDPVGTGIELSFCPARVARGD